ncbi:hypothetical protein BO94DRAFT_86889 [Aspergillus sclerotioniger CBS 115572]|uniref:F-box domain-containing protein n=1 Tax=Aspergillus sclerotioniger CBS 115572 TaxID=1450535 RepID=A0A317WNP8_9EURO|nr:hypothetical protein BO94DRAFT_86889 [Aspergillus sclerotioniger CBS 115572]PWY86558.1 hypothetical protein BO94DRAFT_86889 [Aspergillus sclerotioniger CBS 115572]
MVSLESFPVELIEAIVSLLDFQDICTLRLTGRTLAFKSSNAIFRTYFSSKKLQITEASLKQFVRVTQPGQLGLWLQRLTVYDILDPDPGAAIAEDPNATFEATQLLAQAMENIRDRSPHGGQFSISLQINGRNLNREAPAQVFQVVMSALGSSKLPVQSFDVFADAYGHTWGSWCSLGFSEFTTALSRGTAHLSTSFQPCKKLCLSLGHNVCGVELGKDTQLPLIYDEARQNTKAFCDLLNLCPALEELHFVWEYDDFEESDGILEESLVLDRMAASCEFPNLKKCTWKDVRMTEPALLTFFRKVPGLVHLSIDGLDLHEGESFDGLFNLLSNTMPGLDCLRLRGLGSIEGTIHFPDEPRENWWVDRSRPPPGIIRRGADARRPFVTRTV